MSGRSIFFRAHSLKYTSVLLSTRCQQAKGDGRELGHRTDRRDGPPGTRPRLRHRPFTETAKNYPRIKLQPPEGTFRSPKPMDFYWEIYRQVVLFHCKRGFYYLKRTIPPPAFSVKPPITTRLLFEKDLLAPRIVRLINRLVRGPKPCNRTEKRTPKKIGEPIVCHGQHHKMLNLP